MNSKNPISFWLKLFCIALLGLSFLKLPIGYYTFLRIVVTGTAIYSAYFYYANKNIFWFWVFILLGILFNPISPIYLTKKVWSIIDIITAIVFIIHIFVFKEFKYLKDFHK